MLLIIAAGIVTLLAALGAGLYAVVHAYSRATASLANEVRAALLAESGMQYAVARLREGAGDHPEAPDEDACCGPRRGWFGCDYLHGKQEWLSFPAGAAPYSRALSNSAGSSSDRCVLHVEDAAAKINLNACDNLAVVLDNLCRLIGPPLVAADQDKLLPMRWRAESDGRWPPTGPGVGSVADASLLFAQDDGLNRDVYYWLYDAAGAAVWKDGSWVADIRPEQKVTARPLTAGPAGAGPAVFGDGYAIAGARARDGPFDSLDRVREALTYRERNGNGIPDDPVEELELDVKFALLKPYVTLHSWVDATSVCVGKFEWASGARVAGQLIPDQGLLVRAPFGESGTAKTKCQILIDRDKSWVADDPLNDPLNARGSLRGCWLAVVRGHGAGQLRRIATNGADWVAVRAEERLHVPPGPVSSCIIFAPEDAALECVTGARPGAVSSQFPVQLPPAGEVWLPQTRADGSLVDNPYIDYARRPLCLHRAPVNVNTASEKVLAALFLGLNLQHAHPISLGADVDRMSTGKLTPVYQRATVFDPARSSFPPARSYCDRHNQSAPAPFTLGTLENVPTAPTLWYSTDPMGQEPRLLTPAGLKRLPVDAGKLVLDRPFPAADRAAFGYLDNFGTLGGPDFAAPESTMASEAHELAYRIIQARQTDPRQPALKCIDEDGHATDKETGARRETFRTWDDLYFRVIRPWDQRRLARGLARDVNGNGRYDGWVDLNRNGLAEADEIEECHKAELARLLMAQFNPNTDILKFNPNIEWIDRWGRNFTELEPLMLYTSNDRLGAGESAAGRYQYAPRNRTWCQQWSFPPDSGAVLAATARPIFLTGNFAVASPDSALERADESKFQHLFSQYPLREHGALESGAYLMRGLRYRCDEMIDKTDLNRSTTEFCFDSGGVYEIKSTGQIVQPETGRLLAQQVVERVVQVYDVWRESTQEQFVRGKFSVAGNPSAANWKPTPAGNPGNYSGKLARDASPERDAQGRLLRKALDSLPEPLVPAGHTIANPAGRNREVVDSAGGLRRDEKHDAFGRARPVAEPDVLANRVLPARYDGQLVLAANTSSFDPSAAGDADTFLASFNGDLDTDTSLGNGREQAKTPADARIRVVDTVGLLGRLNDGELDLDPGLPDGDPASGLSSAHNTQANAFPRYEVWDAYRNARTPAGAHTPFDHVNLALDAVKPGRDAGYWNETSARSGDLRADGVFLGGCGVSGKEATLKYLFDNDEDGDGTETGELRNPDPTDYSGNERGWGASSGSARPAAGGALSSPYAGTGNPTGNRVEVARRNFNPASPEGNLVTMWFKPAWRHDDNRHHEFLNASNPVNCLWYYDPDCQDWKKLLLGRPLLLAKAGRFWAAETESDVRSAHAADSGLNMSRARNNDLLMALGGNCDLFPGTRDGRPEGLAGWNADGVPLRFDSLGRELAAALHGGTSYVRAYESFYRTLSAQRLAAGREGLSHRESPGYRIQPFRWSFVGMRWRYPDQNNLEQAKPASARAKSCQLVLGKLEPKVSTFRNAAGTFDPRTSGAPTRRLYMGFSARCPENWESDFRPDDDYYLLPGFTVSCSGFQAQPPKDGRGPGFQQVQINKMLGQSGKQLLGEGGSCFQAAAFADYLGAWGCWRRPVVAPAADTRPAERRLLDNLGRPPPACAMPCAVDPKTYDLRSPDGCTVQAYRFHYWDRSYALPVLLGKPGGACAGGAEFWYSRSDPPKQGNPFVEEQDAPPDRPQPPDFAQLKEARPAAVLIGDHFDNLRFRARPFVDTQRHPEGPEPPRDAYRHYEDYWTLMNFRKLKLDAPCDIGNPGPNAHPFSAGRTGQDVKPCWCDPAVAAGQGYCSPKCFSINNLNSALEVRLPLGAPRPDGLPSSYGDRIALPAPACRPAAGGDGTYAVIDELKISGKETVLRWAGNPAQADVPYAPARPDWSADRARREMTTSRYYLPADPKDRSQCPTFTSQSLLQAARNVEAAGAEAVVVARVGWTVFTPRFAHEYREISEPPRFRRKEYHTELRERNEVNSQQFSIGWPINQKRSVPVPTLDVTYHQHVFGGADPAWPAVGYRGPFDYDAYNPDPAAPLPQTDLNGRKCAHIGVERPAPRDYDGPDTPEAEQPHATRGVEVELLNDGRVIAGSSVPPGGACANAAEAEAGAFRDPDACNRFLYARGNLCPRARVRADRLQYRVRFRYPVDPLVDPAGGKTVDPALHYLLDTPVFDDITIIYFARARVLGEHRAGE